MSKNEYILMIIEALLDAKNKKDLEKVFCNRMYNNYQDVIFEDKNETN